VGRWSSSIGAENRDLPKAKQHLAVLDKLCFFPCEEYSDLKKAVQDYESSSGRVKPASTTN